MKASTTVSLTATMMLLSRADSFVPPTSSTVIISTMAAAGRLTMAVAVVPSPSVTTCPVAAVSRGGSETPKACSRLVK